jgi:putative ABC transport system permease protein
MYGCEWQMADCYAYYSMPVFTKVFPAYLIIYSVIMPPVVSVIVNTLVINKRLSRTALSLIRNEQKTTGIKNVDLSGWNYLNRFRIRQILKERRTAFTVVFGMVICLLILMMGLDCYVLCRGIGTMNSADTHYEYMYSYKYPTKEPPAGGEPCFVYTLSKEKNGYNLDITVIGIDDDNPYYDVTPVKGKNMVVASEGIRDRYGADVGDKVVFSDRSEGVDYAFTVADVVPYSVGLTVFMDIASMRELFGEDEDYYNVILSDRALDIEEGRLYSITRKHDIEVASDIFVKLMAPMVIMMTTASSIIFCIVMYLMMAVMIDRAAFGISLVKIFGYRKRELKKLYLSGNRFIVILGALIGIPVAKVIMDALFPTFVSNVACPVPLRFAWYYYVIIFAGIMCSYEIISLLLTRKLDKVVPAEVLKNRE